MSLYEYQALTAGGRLMTGTLEAGSHEQAREQLKQMQLGVNQVTRVSSRAPRLALGRNEFLLFNQQLAAITQAGIPLERGLRQLADEAASKAVRRLILAVADRLEAGASIDEALAETGGRFSMLYREILGAGVQSGRLNEMLTSLNRHLGTVNQTRRIVFEALTYPLVVLVLAMTIFSGILAFIIPTFDQMYHEFGIDLPYITQLVLNWSRSPWTPLVLALASIGTVAAAMFLLRFFASGRRIRERMWLRLPVFGGLYRNSLLSRLAEAMAVMVASGADLPTCVRVGAETTGSETLKSEAHRLAQQLENGANMVEAGRFGHVISRLFVYSVQLGIQRNELQDNLNGLAEMYRQQVRAYQCRLEAVLLPVMILVVGGMIALSVMGLFLPMVTMMQSLSQ